MDKGHNFSTHSERGGISLKDHMGDAAVSEMDLRLDMSTLWLDKHTFREHNPLYKIPCLFTFGPTSLSRVLIYFHSNAEDLDKSRLWAEELSRDLQVPSLIIIDHRTHCGISKLQLLRVTPAI